MDPDLVVLSPDLLRLGPDILVLHPNLLVDPDLICWNEKPQTLGPSGFTTPHSSSSYTSSSSGCFLRSENVQQQFLFGTGKVDLPATCVGFTLICILSVQGEGSEGRTEDSSQVSLNNTQLRVPKVTHTHHYTHTCCKLYDPE